MQYDLRPAKQTERRILLDILKLGSESGLDISNYSYLGFGGFKFYDFEMLFRHLGIRHMISLEVDRTIFPRCVFNKPFSFIETHQESLGTYLERNNFRKRLIAWLDYDCALSREVVDDLQTIGAKVPIGSFVFATIDARMPEAWSTYSVPDRIAVLREELQEFALNPSSSDVQSTSFPGYAEKVLWAALSAALSKRTDGRFIPLVRLFYKDTALMITVGALLCADELADRFEKSFLRSFPFLKNKNRPYVIPSFNFTARERHILDSIVTSPKSERKLRERMRKIGFREGDIRDYENMVRFLPKYFESYL